MLLDVSPDQSMVDEGVAREVINRIQKLRKKVGANIPGALLPHNTARMSFTSQCLMRKI